MKQMIEGDFEIMSVSGQVIEILDNICERFGIAVDWSQQNVVPYLQELAQKYIKYELATSIVILIFFLIPLLVLIKFAVKICKGFKNDCDYDLFFEPEIMLFVLAFPISILSFGVIYQIYDIIACCTFPEKVIFNFLSQMLKNTTR